MRGSNCRVFFLFFVLLFLSILLFSLADNTFTGKVVEIAGGDTISVMREGRTVKVRLHGVDYPDKRQPFGTRAKRFTSDFAFGKEVTVRIQTTDRYGRIVGVVILPDDTNLNYELVAVGLAWWYRKYVPNDRTLKVLEAKRGLWGE